MEPALLPGSRSVGFGMKGADIHVVCGPMHRMLRPTLLFLGLLALLTFCSFQYVYRWEPGSEVTRISLGFDLSPWLVWESSGSGRSIHLILHSWSWLFAAGGIGILWMHRRIAVQQGRAAPTQT